MLLTLAAGAQAKHGMTVEDVAKLVRVGAPQVSPDGLWVAYTVGRVDVGEDKNVSDLWMVSWDGKQDVQLTQGKDSVGNPRWSPDGRWLAFTSGRDAGPNGSGAPAAKGSQVWLLDRRGGEAKQLTNVKENLGEYRWSPDSKTLLLGLTVKDEPEDDKDKGGKPKAPKPIVLDRFHFKQDVEGFLTDRQQHLYLFDIATKKLTKLTNGAAAGKASFAENGGTWSPDGTMIAFVSNQSEPDPDRVENDDVFVVGTQGGDAPRRLTTFLGPDQGPLAWTADSKDVIYRQAVTPGYSIYQLTELAMVPAKGGAARLLAPKYDHWTGAPVLAADGKSVLTEVQEDRNTFVGELPLSGKGEFVHVLKQQGAASGLNVGGAHTAMLWTTDAAPAEIYALEGNALRKLTGHNDAVAATLAIAPVEELSAKTSDGSEVHSLLTMPVGYTAGTKVPMLLWIHGGPTSQDTHGFSDARQLFAAHGFAVLNVNYRGSTGRGHDYSFAINADWGDKEVKDLQAAVDGAIATGRIDADKLMVGGWSYGGILTDYMIASTTRFKAASSGAGMGNLLVLYGIDEYILQYENEIGPPWKNPELYVKLSYPFFHADRIKTPTLFMGGDKDFNVPIEGGEQMYQALKSVGTPSELIVYPGEFHGFTRPSFIKDRWQRWFAWYDKYALDKPGASAN